MTLQPHLVAALDTADVPIPNVDRLLRDVSGLEWRWLQAALQAGQVRALRATSATDPEQHRARLAQALLRLAAAQAVLGQHSVAADSTREAVDLYRELAALNRDAYLPDLAMSVSNLALRAQRLVAGRTTADRDDQVRPPDP